MPSESTQHSSLAFFSPPRSAPKTAHRAPTAGPGARAGALRGRGARDAVRMEGREEGGLWKGRVDGEELVG